MTQGFPWIDVLGGIPLLGAVVVALAPPARDLLVKRVALLFSLATLVVAIAMSANYDTDKAGYQFVQDYSWIKQFGAHWAVGVDGIALVLIDLVAILVPVVILASWHDATPTDDGDGPTRHGGLRLGPRSVRGFFALMLAMETLLIGVFGATDVLLFYVFFEAMLVPMFFLIGSYGGPGRSYASIKFLLYSLFGGLAMLASVIGLYVESVQQFGHGTFQLQALQQLELSHTLQNWLFLGFFLAFAIKAPMWPFHTWLPDAGAEGPIGGSVMLVGVLDKVGTFGFIRYCIPLFPDASKTFAPYIIAFAIVGILYGGLVAIVQKDLKRLVSYTSIAHFGFIVMGVFAFTSQGGSGAVLYMVNHGLSTGALFLVVGFLIARRGSRNIPDYGGMAKPAPLLAGVFLFAGLSSLALPGMSTFVSEFLVLVGTFTRYPAAAVVAVTGIVLAALYILVMFQRTMHGPVSAGLEAVKDLSVREVFVIAPLMALILFLGFYPKPVTDVITPSVQATYDHAGRHDPPPVVHTAGNRDGAAAQTDAAASSSGDAK
ncbi:MAG TPA: NADH-quinone oxidoreductase subunit M [Mycobacteriales bacterium]|nr:NADH-quinone oxidoreductase subunit M [Mycobacteriales bacterium]